ncbi:Bcl-2-associated athanogene-like protein [Dorcoceras hygrometricum]|uniref:Bcl-2-associated athanogene-like protein n=1 Tax=Dorcoceras hygrometricum TaxID=472368 RepID=A0A2Z7AA20_9LAMI|nr:Bcl-2-associated athanogene-like protein [Dorcoceras hygrometricum]
MDHPFRSWYEPPAQQRRPYAYHPSLFGVPVYPVDPTRKTRQPAYAERQPPVETKSSRRVVQIPVQFFGSDSDRRVESALRIQRVFRGFLVRKSVRKIKEIEAQVDEIEARLLRDEVVEMIRGNERERLRMSESLMNLLLKLDGIRGIDSGIRVCRKGVTRKAVALQEKIDAICCPDSVGYADCKLENGDGVHDAAELEGSRYENSANTSNPNDCEEMLDDSGEGSKGLNSEKMDVERDSLLAGEMDVAVASEANPGEEETLVEIRTDTLKNLDFDEDNVDCVREMLVQHNGNDMIHEEGKEDDDSGNCEFLANSELGGILGGDVEAEKGILEVERNHLITSVGEVTPETGPVHGISEDLEFDEGEAEKEMLAFPDGRGEKLCDLNKELKGEDSLEVGDGTMEVEREHLDSRPVVRSGEDMAAVVENEEFNRRNCGLLKQLMEENKKMMNTMTQLYERNEMQLQMLDALANRVEFLEKAYLCDKLRNRRKKMKKNKCAATCVED